MTTEQGRGEDSRDTLVYYSCRRVFFFYYEEIYCNILLEMSLSILWFKDLKAMCACPVGASRLAVMSFALLVLRMCACPVGASRLAVMRPPECIVYRSFRVGGARAYVSARYFALNLALRAFPVGASPLF